MERSSANTRSQAKQKSIKQLRQHGKAFEYGNWSKVTPAQRAKLLWRVADLIEAQAEELATLETLDGGKLLSGVRNGEIPSAAESFRYYAGWCTKMEGRTPQISLPGMKFHAYTQREPIGVVAQIVPWNGPLVMAAWKLAPAFSRRLYLRSQTCRTNSHEHAVVGGTF